MATVKKTKHPCETHCEVYAGRDGRYRWRVRNRNFKLTGIGGQKFDSPANARRGYHNFVASVCAGVPVITNLKKRK